MNGSFRLALDITPNPITSPLEIVPDLLDADQFALSFMSAVAVVHSDKRKGPSLDITNHDSDDAESPKADWDTPLTSAHQAAKLDPLTASKIEHRDFELVGLTPKEQRDISEETKPQIETTQHQWPVSNVQKNEVLFLQENGAPISLNAPPKSVTVLGKILEPKQSFSSMKRALPLPENETAKSAPLFAHLDLTDSSVRIPEPKIRATEDGFGSSARPAPQTVLAPSQPPPANALAIPTSPIPVPSITSSGKAHATSILVLNVETADQWVAKLSQDIRGLSTEKSTLSFQLKPNHLGKLRVAIATDVAGEIVRLETDNENAKALILASQGRLEQDIRLSGMKLARVDVTMQDQFGSQLEQQGSGSRGSEEQLVRDGDSQVRQSTDQMPASQKPAVSKPSHRGTRYA